MAKEPFAKAVIAEMDAKEPREVALNPDNANAEGTPHSAADSIGLLTEHAVRAALIVWED